MPEETKDTNGAIPPKLDLRKSGLPAAAAGVPVGAPAPVKKQTTRIELAAGQSPAEPSARKKTSRIPLTLNETAPGAAPAAAPGETAKTIRLTPIAPQPAAAPSQEQAPKTVVLRDEAGERAKKQTSRIPLEAALTPPEGGAPSAGVPTANVPKTIRIKRPGQPATIKLARPAAPAADTAAPPTPASPTAETIKSKTAQIDVATVAAGEPGAQPTQRKTIKIRRPEGGMRAAPRSVAVARAEAEAVEHIQEEVEAPGAVFAIVAGVAVLVVAALLVVLVAQAMPDLGIRLPGQVTL